MICFAYTVKITKPVVLTDYSYYYSNGFFSGAFTGAMAVCGTGNEKSISALAMSGNYNPETTTNGKKSYTSYWLLDEDKWDALEVKYGDVVYPVITDKLPSETRFSDIQVKVYEGIYSSASEITSNVVDITDKVYGSNALVNMATDLSNGYPVKIGEKFDITVVLQRSTGEILNLLPLSITMYKGTMSATPEVLYKNSTDVMGQAYYSSSSAYVWKTTPPEDGNISKTPMTYRYMVTGGNKKNDTYYVVFRAEKPLTLTGTYLGLEFVEKAVVGDYNSLSEAASATDIKSKLFSDPTVQGNGYGDDYRNGVTFTVFLKDGTINKYRIVTEGIEQTPVITPDPTPDPTPEVKQGQEATINFTGINKYKSWIPNSEIDSYYQIDKEHGFVPVLIYDSTAATGAAILTKGDTITPKFNGYYGTKVYVDSQEVQSGSFNTQYDPDTPVLFSGTNGDYSSNYWVSYIAQQEGPVLFINGLSDQEGYILENGVNVPVREIMADDYHDIMFANVGSEDITGLYVRLENARNVKLDDYWTIGETTTLSAMDDMDNLGHGYYDQSIERNNVGKIRLICTSDDAQDNSVSGTLVIGFTGDGTNGKEYRINLSGIAGKPVIVTDTLFDGVEKVPYSCLIQNNSKSSSVNIKYELADGELPKGLILKEKTGEIYGLPEETGEFEFAVKMIYTISPRYFSEKVEGEDKKVYHITIKEATKENIEAINNDPDRGYKIETPAPDELNLYAIPKEGVEFVSVGAFSDFVKFFMDGKELTRGTHYSAEEGSTKIIIYDKTFANAEEGNHTLSAEFREGGSEDGAMKTTAQLVAVTKKVVSVAPVYVPSDAGQSATTSDPQTTDAPTAAPTEAPEATATPEPEKKTEPTPTAEPTPTPVVVKNDDGSTTATTKSEGKDGSVTTEEVVTRPDGSTVTTTTVERQNGSSSTTIVEKNAAGKVLSTTKIDKYTTNSGTEVTETYTENADGSSVRITEKAAKSGKVVKKTVETSKEGTVTTTNSTLNPDGSSEYSIKKATTDGKVVTQTLNKDTKGKIKIEQKTKKADGTKVTKKYTALADGSIKLTSYKTKGATVLVPAVIELDGETYPVTVISAKVFAANDAITTARIGRNIAKIGNKAFNGSSNLAKIVFYTSSLESVGKKVFDGIAPNPLFKFKIEKEAYKASKELLKKTGIPDDSRFKKVRQAAD